MSWSIGDLALTATAVIALLALLRPDIERVLQGRKVTPIEMHPAGRLEVGFSNFGPTIGVQGTLQAIDTDRFISSGRVTVCWPTYHPPKCARPTTRSIRRTLQISPPCLKSSINNSTGFKGNIA